MNWDIVKQISFILANQNTIELVFQFKVSYFKTLLHEVKHYRNEFSHQKNLGPREAFRLVNTVVLMFEQADFRLDEIKIKRLKNLENQLFFSLSNQIYH